MYQLQLVSLPFSCSIVFFSVLLQGLGTNLSFCLLSFFFAFFLSCCSQLEWQSPLFGRFSLFFHYHNVWSSSRVYVSRLYYYYYYYYIPLALVSSQRKLMIFLWNLSDTKSSQVSWAFRTFVADVIRGLFWMVSIGPFISNSSNSLF